jgi:hypothetical protein
MLPPPSLAPTQKVVATLPPIQRKADTNWIKWTFIEENVFAMYWRKKIF